MADNFNIRGGSDGTCATDEIATVHYQKIKLVDGTADSTAAIAGDATYGLDVDVTRMPSNITVSRISNVVPVNQFAESSAVVSTTETTILSYVTTNALNIQGVLVTGQAAGRFKLKIGGVTKAIVRTTAAKMTECVDFGQGTIPAAGGSTVTITGYHEELLNQALAANLFGYELS